MKKMANNALFSTRVLGAPELLPGGPRTDLKSISTQRLLPCRTPIERMCSGLQELWYEPEWFNDGRSFHVAANTATFAMANAAHYVNIIRLWVQHRARGQGYGRQVFLDMCKAADLVGVELRLDAMPLDRETAPTALNTPYDLAAWYARAGGFEPLYEFPDGRIRMVRRCG